MEPESAHPFANTRVLIVDDNDTSRQFLDRHMFAWGMRDGCAATAEEAMTKLREAVHEKAPYAPGNY